MGVAASYKLATELLAQGVKTAGNFISEENSNLKVSILRNCDSLMLNNVSSLHHTDREGRGGRD